MDSATIKQAAWCNTGQTPRIKMNTNLERKERHTPPHGEQARDQQVASLMLGQPTGRLARRKHMDDLGEEESDWDEEQFACNMTGERREDFPFPVIIDPGACASVMPTNWCPHVEATSTPQPRARASFMAANGHKIYNTRQKLVTLTTREGAKRDMKFTVCDVSKSIGIRVADV